MCYEKTVFYKRGLFCFNFQFNNVLFIIVSNASSLASARANADYIKRNISYYLNACLAFDVL